MILPDPRPYFAKLEDPRRETKNKLHKPSDILMIVFCAILSGVEDWVNMEVFAQDKESWFRRFLELPNGIPSHDTLSDVTGRLAPGVFAEAFECWTQQAIPGLSGEQICLAGKSLRGRRCQQGAVPLLTAYAAKARLVLAQQTVASKSNEITAIPAILAALDLTGAVVTIDAMGCQKSIAEQIVKAKADYVLALKENPPSLYQDVSLWLDSESEKGRLPIHETIDKDHGRLEIRRYSLSSQLDWLVQKPEWTGLQAVGRIESIRHIGDKVSQEYRYYLMSFTDLSRFTEVARSHWAIENSQHWVLDVQFAEDANRARKDASASNLALIRRMALNVLRHNDHAKRSIRTRKILASINDDFRFSLIFGNQDPI